MPQAQALEPFRIDLPTGGGIGNRLFRPLASGILSKILRLPTLNGLYGLLDEKARDDDFPGAVLDLLDITASPEGAALEDIPAQGPLVAVANHPFGAIEGLVLIHLLRMVRKDVKAMTNNHLGLIPEMRRHIIPVDVMGSPGALRRNLAGIKSSIRHVADGGALILFPAGEVSSFSWSRRTVMDPDWHPMAGRIVRRTGATVLPVYFHGANGPLFQAMGLLHPRLRTAMLPTELLNKRSRTVTATLGRPIPSRALARFSDDKALTDFLRFRSYLLRHRNPAPPVARSVRGRTPVAAPASPRAVAREIMDPALCRRLVETGEYMVVEAPGEAVPAALDEIGRLREISFREAGEGTGKPRDLDRFDLDYRHLILWSRKDAEIVGAYRVGRCDEILEKRGRKGLYTASLFKFGSRFLDGVSPGLELGRAFVVPGHRRSYSALTLLWKGIAQMVLDGPGTRYLFGPVSISGDYCPFSRKLMMEFLSRRHGPGQGDDAAVKPRVRPRIRQGRPGGLSPEVVSELLGNLDEVARAVSEIEPDGKGVPVLLRHYVKLGGTIRQFNLDRDFGNAIDGLVVVDLAMAPRKTLKKYMGPETENFLAKIG